MSKFIGYIFQNKKNSTLNSHITDSAKNFLIKKEKITTFSYLSSEKNFYIKIINKKNTIKKNYFYSKKDKVLTFFSGHPQLGCHLLNAEEIYKIFILDKNKLFNLDGSWTLGFYIESTKSVIFYRDYLGSKPFYYSNLQDGFLFSSNISFIVNTNLINKKINYEFLSLYLAAHPKCAWSRNISIYKYIKTFSPIYSLTLSHEEKKNKFYDQKYFIDNNLFNSDKSLLSPKKYLNFIEEKFLNYYLPRKDSKICITLSGGIDSGIVAHFLNKLSRKKINAFTTSYSDNQKDYSELHKARLTARKFVKNHYNSLCEPKNLEDDFNKMYNFFDTPFATSSVYGFYNLSKKISQNNFDTVFTGLAGNAINSGYYQSYMFNLADLKNNNKLFNFELQEWVRLHSTKDFPKSKKILDLFLDQYIDSEIPGKLHDKIIWLSDKKIIKKNFLKNIRLKSELLNLNNYLNSSILYTLFYDSVATASDNEDWIDWILDLETVSPLGNKELVKLGMNLPDNLKINSGINRTMIRKCFKNILPSEIINDVNTIGFKLPVDEWFRSDLKEFFMDTILSKNFRQRGIYNLKFFDEIVREHMTKKKNNSMLMWQAINFEAWALKWRPEF